MTKEVTLLVRDLLVQHWNPDNVANITPKIHTGWFNNSWKQPQITCTDPVEISLRGGDTGFRAVESDTGNGVKLMLVSVNVAAWAHDEDGSGVNPLDLAWEMSQEIKRIINANPFPGFGTLLLSWAGRQKAVDPGAEPILFQYNNDVRCLYEDRVE